jgi:anti-sigma B factor antagonist
MTEYRYNLRGEVDLASAPQLREDLMGIVARDDGTDLLIDGRNLSFIDSTGIAVLLEANRHLESGGRRMLIANVEGAPRRAFELLGLTDLMRYDRDGDFA